MTNFDKQTSPRATGSCSDDTTNLRMRDKALNTTSELAVMSLLQPQTTRLQEGITVEQIQSVPGIDPMMV